jgi:hypothetical protein
MSSGVKIVGKEGEDEAPEPTAPTRRTRREAARPSATGFLNGFGDRAHRSAFVVVSVLAAALLALTLVFGLTGGSSAGDSAAVSSAARSFLLAFTNFDAKNVDADFGAITAMATGDFAGQAQRFFNSAIRQELEQALASSRGLIRSLYVQTVQGNQASAYAVVDQLYVNNKIATPVSDVLRLVVGLTNVGGTWKISQVTVLQGPTLGSTGSTSTPTTTPAG